MSRYRCIIQKPGERDTILHWGWDHALGFWIDEGFLKPTDDEDEIIWESSETFDGFKKTLELFEKFEEFIPERHIQLINRKIPF